jgi:hypothetical protein
MRVPNPAKFLTDPKKCMKRNVRKFMIALQHHPDYLEDLDFTYFHALYMFRFENGPYVRHSRFYELLGTFCDLPEMTIDIICFVKFLEAMLDSETPGAKEFDAAIRVAYNPCVFCGEHVDEYDLAHRIGIYRGRNNWMEHHYECFFSEEGNRICNGIYEMRNYGTLGLKEPGTIFISEEWDQSRDLYDLTLDLIITRFSLNLDKMDELAIAKYQLLFAMNLGILEQLPEDREDILKKAREMRKSISSEFTFLHLGETRNYNLASRDFEPTYNKICDVAMKCRADDPTLPIIDDYNEEHVQKLIKKIEELSIKYREFMLKHYWIPPRRLGSIELDDDMENDEVNNHMENDDMEIEK